jgi:membrane protein implicated in regulation of membrane protease activity
MDAATFWLIGGAILIALEAMAIPGIGFLFAGFGAVLVGAVVVFGLLPPEHTVWQFGLWFLFTVISALALWKPLKNFRVNPNADNSFNDVVGTRAKVIAEPIKSGGSGKVSWSGTTMNARADASVSGELLVGTEVVITKIEGNTVTVKQV